MSKQMKNRSAFTGHLGYTIDQTILIVAIIAILITIIISTVGWDLINRAGGAKLAAQMRQIEDANGQFYSEHMVWPHQAGGAAALAGSMPVQVLLATKKAMDTASIKSFMCNGDCTSASLSSPMKNLLPGLVFDGSEVLHKFGKNDGHNFIRMNAHQMSTTAGYNGNNTYLGVFFRDVSRQEVLEADKKIDGELNGEEGRVLYRSGGNDQNPCGIGGAASPTDAYLNVCYVANLVE